MSKVLLTTFCCLVEIEKFGVKFTKQEHSITNSKSQVLFPLELITLRITFNLCTKSVNNGKNCSTYSTTINWRHRPIFLHLNILLCQQLNCHTLFSKLFASFTIFSTCLAMNIPARFIQLFFGR